jgi:iron complex outermembrane receptor protein
MPRFFYSSTSIACLIVLGTSGGTGSAESADHPQLLEEVLITATRRVENLQDVPLAVSAFSESFFFDSGVRQLSSLDEYTPNLLISEGTDSRSTAIRIRGIGSVGSNSGVDPSVGVFIDGIYQGRAGMSIADLVDVTRVEVLRGPQGTLYGKNTSAGAINVYTNNPGSTFTSMIEASYDSTHRGQLRGMINIPLGQSDHALRVSGFGSKRDHLGHNTFLNEGVNDLNKKGVRGKLKLDFTDQGMGLFLLAADYLKEDTDCCAFAVSSYAGLSPLNTPATRNPSAQLQQTLGLNASGQPILDFNALEDTEGFSPPEARPFSNSYWFDGELNNQVTIRGASLEWQLDAGKNTQLTWINGWREYQSDSEFDGDFTAFRAVSTDTAVDLEQLSSELRILSSIGNHIDYQAGLYAYVANFDSLGTFTQHEALVDNIAIGGGLTLGLFFPDGSLNIDDNRYRTESYAAFGQVTWKINPSIDAILGLRLTREDKSRVGTQVTEPSFSIDVPPVAGPDIRYDSARSDTALSPMMTLRYQLDEQLMGYATVSRGFKSGGFNQRREVSGSNGEFSEESALNMELGWKALPLNNRLLFNGSLFYVDYDDFQSQTFDGSTVRVTNAGSLESYGAEVDLRYVLLSGLTIGASLGYTHATYEDFPGAQCTVLQSVERYYVELGAQSGSPGANSQCAQDLAGRPLANAPEWNLSSYVTQEWSPASSLRLRARAEYNFVDRYFLEEDLDPHLINPATHLVNVRLTLSNEAKDWEIMLWAENLLDEEYYLFGLDIPTIGGYAGMVAPARMAGLTLRWNQ